MYLATCQTISLDSWFLTLYSMYSMSNGFFRCINSRSAGVLNFGKRWDAGLAKKASLNCKAVRWGLVKHDERQWNIVEPGMRMADYGWLFQLPRTVEQRFESSSSWVCSSRNVCHLYGNHAVEHFVPILARDCHCFFHVLQALRDLYVSHVAASFLSNVRRGALIHTKSAHAVWSNFRRLCLVIVALGQSQFFKPCVSSLGSLRETFQNKIDQIDVASPHSQDGDLMAIGRFQDIEQPEQPGIPSLYCNLLDAWMFEVLNCVRGLSDEDRRHIRGLKRSREGPR